MNSNIAFEVLSNFKNLLIFQNSIAFWVSVSKTLFTAIATNPDFTTFDFVADGGEDSFGPVDWFGGETLISQNGAWAAKRPFYLKME